MISHGNNDNELLHRIAGGDQAALREFYDRHAGSVYQFAFKTLANGADAAEVVNAVMLEVWRKAATFAGQSKVRTWLLGITHHKAVDAVRRKARHSGHEEPDESLVDPHCDLFKARAGAEHAEHVQHCLGTLKDGHRQVVYLTFFEGLSYPEIANLMDIPTGTVKTRMMHAKQQLQRCLSRLLNGNDAVED